MSGTFLLMEEPGPVCLRCADLDQLVFLPSADAEGMSDEILRLFPGCAVNRARAIAGHTAVRGGST